MEAAHGGSPLAHAVDGCFEAQEVEHEVGIPDIHLASGGRGEETALVSGSVNAAKENE